MSTNTIKAIRVEVNLGEFSFDAYEMPNGEKRIGFAGTANVFGHSKEWLGRLHKNLPPDLKALGYTAKILEIEHQTSLYTTRIKTISEQDFQVLLAYECNQLNPMALRLKGVKAPKRTNKSIEKDAQTRLQALLGGDCEIICPSGKIDLLTSTEIIEVKKIVGWKSALGQILVYGRYYPSHKKRIHLIGKAHSSVKIMIEDHCISFGVSVTWE